jgi:hypothetical protein
MKELFCVLFLFLISCNNSAEIKEIEILTYFNSAREFEIYSTTDKSGFTQTLFRNQESNYIINCQSRIRISLMDSIVNICRNKKNEDFAFKSSKYLWYCGCWHYVKVTYENGDHLMFRFPFANDENKQFFPFQSLSNQIQNDSVNATRLDFGQYGNLKIKQEDLSNLIFKKDSIRNAKYWKKKA